MQHFKSVWCKWGVLPRKVTLHYSLIRPPLVKYAAPLFFFLILKGTTTRRILSIKIFILYYVMFFMFFFALAVIYSHNAMWLYVCSNLTFMSSPWLCDDTNYTLTAGNRRGLLLALHTRSELSALHSISWQGISWQTTCGLIELLLTCVTVVPAH